MTDIFLTDNIPVEEFVMQVVVLIDNRYNFFKKLKITLNVIYKKVNTKSPQNLPSNMIC